MCFVSVTDQFQQELSFAWYQRKMKKEKRKFKGKFKQNMNVVLSCTKLKISGYPGQKGVTILIKSPKRMLDIKLQKSMWNIKLKRTLIEI